MRQRRPHRGLVAYVVVHVELQAESHIVAVLAGILVLHGISDTKAAADREAFGRLIGVAEQGANGVGVVVARFIRDEAGRPDRRGDGLQFIQLVPEVHGGTEELVVGLFVGIVVGGLAIVAAHHHFVDRRQAIGETRPDIPADELDRIVEEPAGYVLLALERRVVGEGGRKSERGALGERLVDQQVQQLILGIEVRMIDIFGELEPSVERDLRGRGVAFQVESRGSDETDGLDLAVPAQQQVIAVEYFLGDVGIEFPLLGERTRPPSAEGHTDNRP